MIYKINFYIWSIPPNIFSLASYFLGLPFIDGDIESPEEILILPAEISILPAEISILLAEIFNIGW